MKTHIFIILFLSLLFKAEARAANTLNEAVKEARKQGQVLSAKTRQGVHEIRVVTPQGSVKTIRKPAHQNNTGQRQPEMNSRQNYYQQQPSRQQPTKPDNRRDSQRSRKPEFRRFQRPSQTSKPSRSTRPSRIQRPARKSPPQPRRQPPPRRSNDRDPD